MPAAEHPDRPAGENRGSFPAIAVDVIGHFAAGRITLRDVTDWALTCKALGDKIDWSAVDKEDYLLAMERSPIRDIELKHLLSAALTDRVHDRQIFMKGIDHSYYYEGYLSYKAEEL